MRAFYTPSCETCRQKPRYGIILIALSIFLTFTLNQAVACTVFFLKDNAGNMVFGKNLDFSTGIAHFNINKKGLQKSSMPYPSEKPFTWTSKYGSISFNMLGKEFSQGGMNEAGLVIETLLVQSAPDIRRPITVMG